MVADRGYSWNEHGICLNPETAFEAREGRCCVSIRLALTDDGSWGMATVFSSRTAGHGHGVSSERGLYATRDEAIDDGLARLRRQANAQATTRNSCTGVVERRECRRMVEQIDQVVRDRAERQLSLFA